MSPSRSRLEDRFYLAVGIYVFALGFLGFARNFYLLPFGSEMLPNSNPIYPGSIVHGLICTAWMALAVLQPWLVLKGRYAAHRKTGRWGVGVAALLVITGVYVGIMQAVRFAEEGGRSPGFIAVPIIICALFALAVALAIHFRRTPRLHKSWMVIAHCMILEPAAARALLTLDLPVFPFIIVLIALPVIAGAAFDAIQRRRVPWLYLFGIAYVIGSGFVRNSLARDPGFGAFVERLLS